MLSAFAFVRATGIGIVAGLRSMSGPALVSWAAHLGSFELQGTPLKFIGSTAAVALFSLLALDEYATDLLPTTPHRTAPVPLGARILMGGLAGACLCAAAGQSIAAGAVFGAMGGAVGAFAGQEARTRRVKRLRVKDAFVAIPEDLVAIGLAWALAALPGA